MKRLVIAVDCDDVLTPATEACVRIYNATYGTNVQLENAHDSNNPDWQIERDELLRRLSALQRGDEFTAVPPFEEAIHACERLAKNHELHLVTARQKEVIPTTIAMLEEFFPGVFTEVEHAGLDGNKGEICSTLSADVLIDDNVKHLDGARECGITHLIRFGDYVWSKPGISTEDIVHCLDWPSVEKEIERIANDQL